MQSGLLGGTMKKQFCILLSFLLFLIVSIHANNSHVVHVFGDSHSEEFKNIPGCIVHWLGPITMHRVGRDNLSVLDLRACGVLEKQVVVFAFGEIDVRFHIGKQIDIHKRSLENVLETLTKNYLNTILSNRNLYKKLSCIVYSVTPPTDNYSPEFCYGTIKERIHITKELNSRLSNLCNGLHINFLDVYDDYSNPDGSLNTSLSDGSLHISSDCYQPISKKLNKILRKLK